MIAIKPSRVEDICLAGQELFKAHVEECEPTRAGDLDPDWDRYQSLENEGNLVAFGAWEGKKLVGYIAGVYYSHLRYRGRWVCQVDVFYVDRDYRRQRVGLRLLNKLRAEVEVAGVHELSMHAKPGSALEGLLRLLNFQVEETTFTEEVGSWVAQAGSSGRG